MNKKTLCGVLCLLAVLAMEFSNVSAAQKIKREKLQVFIMLGQSNMVGLADVRTFEYLLQDPYRPAFEEVKETLAGALYYVHIYSQYGWELEQKMLKDPKYFTLHPRELRGVTRREIIRTLPDDLRYTEKDLYNDMISRLEARIPLRKKMAERFIKGTTEADFEKLGPLAKEVKNLPEVKADPTTERLAYAKAVEKAINLPVAKRTHIYAYGALTSPTGESNIQKEANGPLSIGYGSGKFKGNVTTVHTLPYFPTELSILGDMMYKARKAGPEYKTSEQYAEWAKVKGISNKGYHYMGSAEFFVEASDAFANAMVEMMKNENND